ncbi:MAG TPA: cupin domain-containing protein [Clostridia bacterium]|nr:cupin domain-containing protein [Clostridia bacterium]
MNINRWTDADGPLTEAALRRKLEGLGYAVNRYLYPPGSVFDSHSHAVDKIDAVLSGQFRVTMGGESVVLRAGEWVYVPKNIEHAAEVVGDEPVLSLDGVRRK